jgi:4,5-dihydroxyphthalate decarboxylase
MSSMRSTARRGRNATIQSADRSSGSFPTSGRSNDYFCRTGCFPPQHLMVLRRDIWEHEKWITRRLTEAFIRCNDHFAASVRNFPYVSPWLDAELEETEALMGVNFHPYGFEENRDTISIFCRQAYELDIVKRLITAEEYFAEYLTS